MVGWLEVILRLILASVVGGIIGIEREFKNRPAGLRTHVLVALGSALIMLISVDGFNNLERGGDPARLAAQVVSGIGFLGAGTIMRTENRINGLTTAASLWVSAGIGLAAGAGYYLGAIATGFIALVTLMKLGKLDRKIWIKNYVTIGLVVNDRPGIIGEIGTIMGNHKLFIKDISIEDHFEDSLGMKFVVKTPTSFNLNKFYNDIHEIKDINRIYYDE